MEKYLLFVRKYNIIARDYVLYVYECETDDIFHTMGEFIYRSFEHIQYINFLDDTICRREFLKLEGIDILPWKDKYPYEL